MDEEFWQAIADAGVTIVEYKDEDFYQAIADADSELYGTGLTVARPDYPLPSKGWFFSPRWPSGGPHSAVKGPHGPYETREAALVAAIEFLVRYIDYLR